MLIQLSISNYALIRQLEITPSANFNVITGETGAGKSIMLGAVGLMMGNRADSKVLYEQEKKCVVEGSFNIKGLKLEHLFEALDLDYEGDECIIRRVISPNGKSRAFINDQPVTLDALKKISNKLLDIHSQHDNLLLSQSGFQLNVLDIYAETLIEKDAYQRSYKLYKQAVKKYDELNTQAEAIRKEQDFNQFQFEELQKVNLVSCEEVTLASELDMLENSEDIKIKLNESVYALSENDQSILEQLKKVSQNIATLTRLSSSYTSINNRLESNLIDLRDLAYELQRFEETIEHDPTLINSKRERLDLIIQLQLKHGVDSVDKLIDIQERLEEKLQVADSLEDELSQLKKAKEKSLDDLVQKALTLTDKRVKSFNNLQDRVIALIRELGMPDGIFKIQREEMDFNSSGADKISFLFSANKGISPQPIAKIASGGEFSRLMFSLKYLLAEKSVMPTLIFDEIETGISGEVSFKMLEMIQSISKKHQIISISHLPQFAAKGDHHYFVFKDHTAQKSVSKIKKLESEERIEEISKMIGGANPSNAAIDSAKELLTLKVT